jgi:signal transduction histidine kinase/ActR/RegA family two-component response regulator
VESQEPSGGRAPESPVRAGLNAALDRFLPANVTSAIDGAWRPRLAVAISFLVGAVLVVLAVAHLVAGHRGEALVNLALSAAIGAGPFVLRKTGRYALVVNASLAVAVVGLFAIGVFERGAGINAATVALAEIPLFATLLLGVRSGTAWAVFSCVASSALGGLAYLGIALRRSLDLLNDEVVLVVVTGTLYLVAVLYERGRSRSLAQIAELEARRHRTELEQLKVTSDARVAQAERLASLGRIASAVAHEINNPLSYVQTNLEFVATETREGHDELRAAVDESLDGIRRVRQIVLDLHQFTRPAESESGADVTASIEAALKMAASHLRPRATVEVVVPPMPRVRGDSDRLTQVFLNLLVNAAQAMTEGHAADHRVEVRAEERDGAVLVEIADTGAGIPPDVIHRVTDPFFSSKPTGEGLGLGLAVSHAILESIGGALSFESRPGRTVARVRLVALARSSVAPAPSEDQATSPPKTTAILIVDDEPFIGRALSRHLRAHAVTIARSGAEALALIEGGARYDLILCDMMMPELSGMDVYEAVQKKHPELLESFVFMTGGTFTTRAQAFRETVQNVFIAKPIDVAVIHSLVQAHAPS